MKAQEPGQTEAEQHTFGICQKESTLDSPVLPGPFITFG